MSVSHTQTQADFLCSLNTAESVFIQHTMWRGYSEIKNAVQGLWRAWVALWIVVEFWS